MWKCSLSVFHRDNKVSLAVNNDQYFLFYESIFRET